MKTTEQRILVVDDEKSITDLITMALHIEGATVEVAHTGLDALHAVESFRPHLVVLDVMLPDLDGFTVLERMGRERRSADIPVLFLTARGDLDDRLRGLDLGGDDYMTKPFSVEEMLLRINAILRRTERYEQLGPRLVVGDLELDEDSHEVRRDGVPVELTPTEFRLLHYLMANAGQVVSKSQIRDRVLDYSFDGKVNMVEVYISYLRKKLNAHGPALIRTVRGIGYSMAGPSGADQNHPRGRCTMTLRLRLLLLLVGFVAAGLIISDVVTYNALRSFLTTRVDQQLDVAAFPVGRALLSSSGLGPKVPLAPAPSAGPTRPRRTDPFSSGGDFRNGGGLHGPTRGSDRGVLVPPGTYGQLRNAQGKIEAHLFFSYGGKAPTAPTIPARLPGSGLASRADLYFSTSSAGAGGISYRAVAKPLTDGKGVIVVALPLDDLDTTLRRLLLTELFVSGAVLLGLAVLSWVMVRRDLRPLQAMTKTAGAIAHGDLTQRVAPMPETTEVGQLGQAFNTMIDEIEVAFAERAASEDRLRRFLADASHELRTPLTSIRGYAELFELGMQDRPADLATSMRHIRDEAARMGTLVDDLFLLAQLDHERPLHFEPVDLVDVVHQAGQGLSVSSPARPVRIEGVGPMIVEGDRDRLRQVVDNLAVNAVNHSPEGASIEIRVLDDGAWVVLRVHDDGPGIDPVDAPRIFEPFYRSDPSRSRSSGGAGLGLAIVAAIVAAHKGTVTVQPGPGPTFEVRIPKHRDGRAGPVGDGVGDTGATETVVADAVIADTGAPGSGGSNTGATGPDAVADVRTGAPSGAAPVGGLSSEHNEF